MFQRLRTKVSPIVGGMSLPDKAEADFLTEQVRYTPDNGWLEQFKYQFLFCPDETQMIFPNYSRIGNLEEETFTANGYTGSKFNFWEQRADRLPVPMKASGPSFGTIFPPALQIKGEVHLVRTERFKTLDTYKLNTVQYLRKRVGIIIPNRPVLNRNVDTMKRELPPALQGKKVILGRERLWLLRCWMYIGNPEYWDDVFDAGYNSSAFKHVHHLRSKRAWLEEYYYYTRHEFKE